MVKHSPVKRAIWGFDSLRRSHAPPKLIRKSSCPVHRRSRFESGWGLQEGTAGHAPAEPPPLFAARPVRLAERILVFQSGGRGSIPLRVTERFCMGREQVR